MRLFFLGCKSKLRAIIKNKLENKQNKKAKIPNDIAKNDLIELEAIIIINMQASLLLLKKRAEIKQNIPIKAKKPVVFVDH